MFKVIFLCDWGETSTNLLKRLSNLTPGCIGKWKNIIGTDNIKEADYFIILDNLPNKILQKGEIWFMNEVKDTDKILYFERENRMIQKMRNIHNNWFFKKIFPKIKRKYIFDKYKYSYILTNFINLTYDDFKNLKYPPKNKDISCIISNKSFDKWYISRQNIIKNYAQKYKDIDVYGKGWKQGDFNNCYKGELGSYFGQSKNNTTKFDGLINYNYSLCLENYPFEDCISEKITDSLLCWCMPIYNGSLKTKIMYPKNSFYLIDGNNKNLSKNINLYKSQKITEENIKALKTSRDLILDVYNIWEMIHQSITNPNNFDKLYKYQINYQNILKSFISPTRFDLMAKYLFIKFNDKKISTTFYKDLYIEHIRTFNNGYEIPRNSNTKSTKTCVNDFVEQFYDLINSIKQNQFNNNYPIPVGTNNIIINGAHRLMICYYYNIEPQFIRENQIGCINYNYDFFKFRNTFPSLNQIYRDRIALEYIKIQDNMRCMIVYPNIFGHINFDKIIDTISEYGYVYYEKQIRLTNNGFKNLLKEMYRGEQWIGGYFPNNDCGGKYGVCHADDITMYYAIYFYDLSKVIECKEKCRSLFNLNKHSLHISDYNKDTFRISSALLNNNSIDFLNNSNVNISLETQKLLLEYFNLVDKNREDYCITSSMLLEMYGLRKANDIDYLHITDNNLNHKDISVHSKKWLSYYTKSKDEIIYNPNYYFYFNGYKFSTLQIVKEMKENRKEEKDIRDLELINGKINSKKIILRVWSGVCNQIIPLLSCIRIAIKDSRNLEVLFKSILNYNGEFLGKKVFLYNYFEKLYPLTLIRDKNWNNVIENSHIYNPYGLDNGTGIVFLDKDREKDKIVFNNIVHFISFENEQVYRSYLDIVNINIEKQTIFKEWREIAQSFIPIQKIRDKVEEVLETFDTKVLGIHIRSKDGGFTEIYNKNQIILFNKIETFLENNKEWKIYISTDNIIIEKKLIKKYKNKILCMKNPYGNNYEDKFENNQYGTINGLCEIYILSKCDLFLGNYPSSFTIFSWLLRNDKELIFWNK